MLPKLSTFFRPTATGRRLYLLHTPADGTAIRGAVLYVHPWADEMNKVRRMAALTSRALAARGFAVLQVDLLGCGDSSGDFHDATWDAWVDDTVSAGIWLATWITEHGGQAASSPVWLWGARAGALLACAASPRLGRAVNLLFWQPTSLGKSHLQQFLRLKAATQLADGGGKSILEGARADLAAGRPVHVAGYLLAPGLARGLAAAQLTPPPAVPPAGRVVWLETSSQPAPEPSPAVLAAVSQWQAAGWSNDARAVHGPAFWQTTEVEDAPALIDATAAALAEHCPFTKREASPAAPIAPPASV